MRRSGSEKEWEGADGKEWHLSLRSGKEWKEVEKSGREKNVREPKLPHKKEGPDDIAK